MTRFYWPAPRLPSCPRAGEREEVSCRVVVPCLRGGSHHALVFIQMTAKVCAFSHVLMSFSCVLPDFSRSLMTRQRPKVLAPGP